MNWYKKAFKKIAKHVFKNSAFCIQCGGFLFPYAITKNPNHHFPFGMQFKCSCGASEIWTNSIRNEAELNKYITTGELGFITHGFCNDLFDPNNWETVHPKQNGQIFYKHDGTWKPVLRDPYEKDGQYFIDVQDVGEVIFNQEAVDQGLLTSFDIYGSANEDSGTIVMTGNELKEGEYGPIFDWYKTNKGLIPPEALDGKQ